MLTLYQFPISHYCEKVRWSLDHKSLNYQIKNLLPGLHTLTTKKLSQSSSLPILVHDGKAIQNSSDILTYLDTQFPQNPLTPEDETLKQEAADWEKFADEQIGIAVRVVCYHVLLDHPEIVIPFFAHNGHWYGSYLLKAISPKLLLVMRKGMNINAETAETANKQLGFALDKIHSRLQDQPFLVGEQFTRADIAVASLLAPLCKPVKYGLEWPKHFPESLEAVIRQHSEKLAWVDRLYAEYR
ncbi:glutathione S-transferase family protein [Methyloglobulus sp.]|uniref:glutathione S-transferase family protein n=1 Tax=Methyloglobulus sp. TaxID=2518622 RepID=UPI0032B75F82